MTTLLTHRFNNKVVLVTGAAQGIGASICRYLVSEGAFVYALDVNNLSLNELVAEINLHEIKMKAIVADICDYSVIEKTVAQIEQNHAINYLVNAAGVLTLSEFESTALENWENIFNVNARGTFIVSQLVTSQMITRGKGAIVNIASNAGATPRINMSAYCASKAAVIMLTKCMGLELGKHGIRCNVVSPGSTNTPMLRALNDNEQAQDLALIEGDLTLYRTGIPLGRIAEPEDIARSVAFLLSDEANHITMQVLTLDGGATF